MGVARESERQRREEAAKAHREEGVRMPSTEVIELDPKTEAVLKRKGYAVKNLLSEGSFGKVYKAQKKTDGILAAVKVMDTEKMSPDFRDVFLPRELEMLIKIRHPYVLEVFDIFKNNKKIFIFMEFAPNGDLAGQCKEGPPPLASSRKWIRQSAEALTYMHDSLDICHRDIKLENILLNPAFDAKLSDFGFSRVVGSGLARTVCGTTCYYSPELISRKYDPKKADVWALGCVLFALCCARLPFADWPGKRTQSTPQAWTTFTQNQMNRSYKKRDGYSRIPADVKDLIDKCMEPDPSKRLTAAQVAKHKALR